MTKPNQSITDNVQLVKDALDYQEYFMERVSGLNRAGEDGQYVGLCPFHDDTKSSFSVNVISGLWNCKAGCIKAGDVIHFHEKFEKLDGFKSTLASLAKIAKVTLDIDGFKKGQGSGKKKTADPEKKKKTPPIAREVKIIPMEVVQECQQALISDEKIYKSLLANKGLTEETLNKYFIGYSRKHKRIAIPIFNEKGDVVNIRIYDKRSKSKMNSWAAGYGSTQIYGLNDLQNYPKDEPVILCEGEWDRLMLVQNGFNAVCHTNGATSYSKHLNPWFESRHVICVYDADGAGVQGARKAASLLYKTARLVQVLDLKDVGLVEGTKEDNDVSDLFIKDPENALRRFQAALQEAYTYVPEGGQFDESDEPESPFWTIFEDNGAYFKPNKDSKKPLSNFTIKPKRWIHIEEEQVLEAKLIIEDGTELPETIALQASHWANKTQFKKMLPGEAGWKGSDDDLQELKTMLAAMDSPRVKGVETAGIHKIDGVWTFVATDQSLTATEEIDSTVFWNAQTKGVRYLAKKVSIPKPNVVGEMINRLFEFNSEDVVGSILGWMAATPFKARFPSAIPMLRRQFPLLLLWGERGAGKTKTAEIVIQSFFNDYSRPNKIDETTKFTLMLMANSTNTVPLIFDEYKPSKMSLGQVMQVSNFIRSSFDSETGSRGKSDAKGGLITEYIYGAPIVLMGEQTLLEPATKERVIEVIFNKKKRLNKDIEALSVMNLSGLGLAYIRWTLSLSDVLIGEVYKAEFTDTDIRLKDRMRQNVTTVRFGLRMLEAFLASLGIDENLRTDVFIRFMEEGQIDSLMDGGESARSDIDILLEGLSSMAAMGNHILRDGEDWIVKDDLLYIRLTTAYPKLKKWAREHVFDGDVLDINSLRRRFKDEEYFVGRKLIRIRSGEGSMGQPVKMYAFDIDKLQKRRLDLSGFEISDEIEPDEEAPF